MNRDKSRKMLPAGHHALHPGPSLPQEASPRPEEAGSQVSQNRDALFPIVKDWRRVATRYDRCAHVFRSAILLAATILFW